MSRRAYKKGTTSVTVNFFIGDSSVTTGAGKTGLAFNTASLIAYYVRPLAAPVAITLATQTPTGAYSSGGFVEISAANMPGWYRLDLPDTVCATGVNEAEVQLSGATNMRATNIEIDLTNQEVGDLNASAISSATFAAGAINNAALAAGAIAATNFAAGAINNAALATGAIAAANFAAGAINAAAIASAALTDAKFDVIPDLASDPGTTPSVLTALALLYASIRNASTTTATAKTIKNNAGTTILTKTLSDDGTTFSASKVA